MALVAMAIANLGHEARSFTGSQAGVITDSSHGRARIIDVTPGRIRGRAGRGAHRDRRRLPGRQPGQQGHHHARPRRLRHDRRRAGRGAQGRRLRDLHRRRRRLHRRPADRARAPARSTAHLQRGDAGDGGVWCQDPAPALRGVRPPVRHADPRAVARSPTRRAPGSSTRTSSKERRSTVEAPDHRRRRARPQRGQDHRRRRAGQARRGGRDLPGLRRRRDQHRHDRAERLRGGDRADRHLVHAAPRPTRRPAVQALKRDPGRRSASTSLQFDDQIGKVSLIGAGMRSHPGVTRDVLRGARRRRASTSR